MMLLPVCLGRDMDMEPKRVNNLARGRRATYRAQTEPNRTRTTYLLKSGNIYRSAHRRVMKNLLSLQRRTLSGDVMKSVPTRHQTPDFGVRSSENSPHSMRQAVLEVPSGRGQMHTLLL